MIDQTVEDVKADLDARSVKGIKKYGTTVADNPGDLLYWLKHAYEETLDKALYLNRAIAAMSSGSKTLDEAHHQTMSDILNRRTEVEEMLRKASKWDDGIGPEMCRLLADKLSKPTV